MYLCKYAKFDLTVVIKMNCFSFDWIFEEINQKNIEKNLDNEKTYYFNGFGDVICGHK